MTENYLKRQLPTWLRAVELKLDASRLAAVDSAAMDLGETLSGREILDITLLAHGWAHGDAFALLNEALQDRDPTFGGRPDDLETAIAASATVAAVLARDSKSASTAAQGVLSARWQGLTPAVAELPDIAATTSRRRSEEVRRRRSLPRGTATKDLFESVPDADSEEDGVNFHDLGLLKEAIQELANELFTQQRTYASVLSERLNAADEELDVLWWTVSGYSELAKTSWSRLASRAAPLICGIELGDKVAFEIELPSTEALLARLLGPDDNGAVTLAEAVDAAGTVLGATLGSIHLPDGHPLLPILSCMSEYRTLQGAATWQGSVLRWGIEPGRSVERRALARQAVLERTLMSNISDG